MFKNLIKHSFRSFKRQRSYIIINVLGLSIGITCSLLITLISISALIACPVIYYIAGKWLENFYYKISLSAFSFVAGLTIALGIAIVTISYRIHMAARANPAQSLNYE